MIDFHQPDPEGDRSSQIRDVLASVYRKRAAGEAVDDRNVIESHPDLMPELEEKLRSLRRVWQAREIAKRATGASVGVAAGGDGPSLPRDAIPGYELLARIHEGGQGTVYRARQRSTNREVAVKVLRSGPHVFTGDRIRFEQEARILARLRHPNIVTVHDCGVARGWRFLVMDLIEGRPLDVYLQETELDQGAKLRLFLKICDAVHAAHLFGVIHRDLKPSNVLIDERSEPFVVDFGLAKLREDEFDHGSGPAVTMTGQLVGSLPWLSPEQAEGGSEPVSTRTDVHALGLILYYAVAKTHAFSLIGSVRDQLETIIHEAPRRPSSTRSEINDDLDTIILKCLAKEPERRYPNAGDLAKDLRRYLAQEPIEAKRDSTLYRLRKYGQRHRRMLATAGATTAVFLAVAAVVVGARRAAAERARLGEIEAVLAEANELIDRSKELRISYERRDNEFRQFKAQQVAEYFPPEKDRRMFLLEDEIERVRMRREEAFYTVLDLLRRAEQLGAEPDRVRHTRGRLFLQEYFDTANYAEWNPRFEQLRKRIYANDPTGRLRQQMSEKQPVSFMNLPPDTEAYLFRQLEQSQVVSGGQHRLVPVPAGDPALPVAPGTWALRVVAGAGPIRPGDLILSIAGHPTEGTVLVSVGNDRVQRFDRLVSVDDRPIRSTYDVRTHLAERPDEPVVRRFEFERDDTRFAVTSSGLAQLGITVAECDEVAEEGGAPAQVWQHGELRELVLPEGLALRTTSRPLFTCPEARIEPKVCYDYSSDCLRLEAGSYVLLFRSPGYEDVVYSFAITGRPNVLDRIQLPVAGTTPPGFRYIPSHFDGWVGPFWIKEHEVTNEEYIRFLNHPRTQERLAKSPEVSLFPRSEKNASTGGYWKRADDGRFELPDSWDPAWPVFGVSWHDATAYADWLTEQARESGLNHVYSLPTMSDWGSACVPVGGEQKFAFGYRFRAKWMSSCFARPTPRIEPVKSFPIDETIYGVYDTAGSVSEWLDDWWLEDRGLRRHAGGSWADGGPEDMFGVQGGGGMRPDQVSNTVGFRVVLRIPAPERRD